MTHARCFASGLLAWALLLPSSTLLAQQADGSRSERERFLLRAPVVSVREVGEGVSRPLKVTLGSDGREMKAIFKSIDLLMEMETFHGTEKSDFYQDSYKVELAAYALDKLLGFGLLPPIVERVVDGKRGSLREWVDDVRKRYEGERDSPSPEDVDIWTHTAWLFDYLIYNVDRGDTNVMVYDSWFPLMIDNSMCLNTFTEPMRPLYRFPQDILARMRTVDRSLLGKVMRPYLRRDQIDALMRRIRLAIAIADDRIAKDGEEAVLFPHSEYLEVSGNDAVQRSSP